MKLYPFFAWTWHNYALTWSYLFFVGHFSGKFLSSKTQPNFKRGYQPGMGMLLVPEMLAVCRLVSYTAAFIAESEGRNFGR